MKAAQRQFVVTVDGIPGTWMRKTGGNLTSQTSKVYDGGSLRPTVLASPAEADNITVSKGYDPEIDGPLLQRLRQVVGRFRTVVSVVPTDEDMIVAGDPVVYSDAVMIGLNDPDVDAASGDPAVFELTFAVGSWR